MLQKRVKRRKKRPKDTSAVAAIRLKKIEQIQEVLSSNPLDLDALRELAISEGGLVKGKCRFGKYISIIISIERRQLNVINSL